MQEQLSSIEGTLAELAAAMHALAQEPSTARIVGAQGVVPPSPRTQRRENVDTQQGEVPNGLEETGHATVAFRSPSDLRSPDVEPGSPPPPPNQPFIHYSLDHAEPATVAQPSLSQEAMPVTCKPESRQLLSSCERDVLNEMRKCATRNDARSNCGWGQRKRLRF